MCRSGHVHVSPRARGWGCSVSCPPGAGGPAVAARVPVTTAPRVTIGVADSSPSDCIIFPLDPTGERQQRASLVPRGLGIFPVFPSFAISFVFCLILHIFYVASQAVKQRIISEMHSSYELCGGSLSSEAAPGSSESLLDPSLK